MKATKAQLKGYDFAKQSQFAGGGNELKLSINKVL